jgi:hypothetical protein
VDKWKNIQLPEGFTPITAGEFGEPWDFEEQPLLVGSIVGELREMEVGKGRDKRMARVTTILNDEDGRAYNVWDSAALHAFFDALTDGLRVSVAFQGYRDTGKQSPMKVFMGAIATDEMESKKESKPARKAARKSTRR